MEVLKVSSKSNPNSCAGAVAAVLRSSGLVEIQVVGAGALNQAVKAVAIARGFLEPSGIDLVCVPVFADIEIDGQNRTAIRLIVDDRQHRRPEPVSRPAGPRPPARANPSPAAADADPARPPGPAPEPALTNL